MVVTRLYVRNVRKHVFSETFTIFFRYSDSKCQLSEQNVCSECLNNVRLICKIEETLHFTCHGNIDNCFPTSRGHCVRAGCSGHPGPSARCDDQARHGEQSARHHRDAHAYRRAGFVLQTRVQGRVPLEVTVHGRQRAGSRGRWPR